MVLEHPRQLFPLGVALESIDDFSKASPLSVSEENFVSNSVITRIREFRAGRHCAKEALKSFGVTQFDLLVGPNREPIWPQGFIGSITHSSALAASVVAKKSMLLAIGLDIEPAESLPPGIATAIASDEELNAISNFSKSVPWDRLLFSAKESFFKAWFPKTERWLDFHDVTVHLSPKDSLFRVIVNTDAPDWVNHISGRFLLKHGHVWTGVCV